MSWFRKAGSSMLRHSVSLANTTSSAMLDERMATTGPLTGMSTSQSLNRIDSRAALDSFKTHWIQAYDIMRRKILPPGSPASSSSSSDPASDAGAIITSDDVTSILNHIDQMVTLLLQESSGMTSTGDSLILSPDENSGHSITSTQWCMVSPLLDYLLVESILDKLLTWSSNVGEFTNIMKLKQLELYTLLVDQLCHRTALFTRPLVRPLFQLLATCSDCAPVDVEKRFVILLNSLSRCLCQNLDLLDLFFVAERIKEIQASPSGDPSLHSDQSAKAIDGVNPSSCNANGKELTYLSPSINPTNDSSPQVRAKIASIDKPEARFLIFSLLIPFVHREGDVGREARDALLKIVKLSKSYESIGRYVAQESNFCPVLATGLSGLYSSLPRKIQHDCSEDWHQITEEEIQEIPELAQFLMSLDFCDTVVKESHPLISKQLIEFIHQGFLSSVIGPALHQDVQNVPVHELEQNPKFANTLEEMIATTAYLDLFLRRITEPSLLYVFLKLICIERFDDQQILLNLISRMSGSSKLSLVTLVLFETMINIACEDVMFELIFKHLMPGHHLSEDRDKQISRMDDTGCFDAAAHKFLSLIRFTDHHHHHDQELNQSSAGSLTDDGMSNSSSAIVLSHYMEYLNDAHFFVSCFTTRSEKWSSLYDSKCMLSLAHHHANSRSSPDGLTVESPSGSENTCSDSGVFVHLSQQLPQQQQTQPLPNNALNHSSANSFFANPLQVMNGSNKVNGANISNSSCSNHVLNTTSQVPEILLALESETQVCHETAALHPHHLHQHQQQQHDSDVLSFELDETSRLIGPFLSILLSKLRSLLHNDVYTNLRITGVVARLASFPQPILRSFLLSPIVMVDSKVSTLYDILCSIANDTRLMSHEISDFDSRLMKARSLFIAREEALYNSNSSNFIRYVHDHYSDSINDRRISTECLSNESKTRRRSLKDFLFRSRTSSNVTKSSDSSQSVKPVLECVENGKTYRYRNRGSVCEIDDAEIKTMLREDRIVAGVVIFEEFCKELSAIAQEHFIHMQIY